MLRTEEKAGRVERRHWERYPPDGRTSVTLAAGGRVFGCELLDLSLGGARLRVPEMLPDDDDLVLQHRVAGLFPAAPAWRRGNELGLEFRTNVQEREHALQCAAVLLYADADINGAQPSGPTASEGGRAAG